MEIITKTRFEKDIKKLKKRRKDFTKLEKVICDLISGVKLGDKDKGQLILYRTGTHSDLF